MFYLSITISPSIIPNDDFSQQYIIFVVVSWETIHKSSCFQDKFINLWFGGIFTCSVPPKFLALWLSVQEKSEINNKNKNKFFIFLRDLYWPPLASIYIILKKIKFVKFIDIYLIDIHVLCNMCIYWSETSQNISIIYINTSFKGSLFPNLY